jgi:DNA-binding transcriptional regulator WhiA
MNPPRPVSPSQPRVIPRGLAEAAAARARDVEVARGLLACGAVESSDDRRALQLRVDHPDAPLSELAGLFGMSKGAVAGRLRRLLAHGERLGVAS